jgi:hypothetical protein
MDYKMSLKCGPLTPLLSATVKSEECVSKVTHFGTLNISLIRFLKLQGVTQVLLWPEKEAVYHICTGLSVLRISSPAL